jgi:predicted alpha/beta superfamily hydrolase
MNRRLVPSLVTAAILLAGLCSEAQVQPERNQRTLRLQSKILKESRSLLISKPDSYDRGTDRYPVLYVLDAEANFEYVTAIVHFLSENDSENEFIPEMIVVGINNPDDAHRTHDLTPPSQAEIDNRFSPGNGGADVFLSFFANELVPYVEQNYRTRPYRVVVGHSFGGLFAIHALLTDPKLFNAYIAIDPSLSWNNKAEILRAQRFFSEVKELQADLFISAADWFGTPTPDIRSLAALLDDHTPRDFRWKFEYMSDENHISIPLPSVYSGLKTIFDGWYLINPLRLFDEGGLQAVDKHFREGARRYGFERTTPPFTISFVVAGLIKTGRLQEASSVLLHDPKSYPPPWNQLDALARAYAETGDRQQAIRYYRLSLEQNPDNAWARNKLKDMGVDGSSPKNNP